MEILLLSSISAMIVFNVGASNCPPFDVNTVNVKGVLGENIHMQCDIDPKLCDKVLWKKKPSAHHLNETGCDNGYCIHHTTDKSVLEFPNISPDHCGSYECWCNRGRPEPLLISCFELSAVCQMRIILPGVTLVHNGSVSSTPGDAKDIDTKPGDRHKIECQDGAEHFTTCIPLDDGTFTVTEYEQECWHLCSLPVSEISETCEVRASLRVHQPNGQHSIPWSGNSLGVVHGKRVKRDGGDEGPATMMAWDGDNSLSTTQESISTTTKVSSISSTGGVTNSRMTTNNLTTQEQDSISTLSPPQSAGTTTSNENKKSSPSLNTARLTTKDETVHTTDMAQDATMVDQRQDTTTNETQQDDLLSTTKDRSTSSKKTPEFVSYFDDCTKLSILVAVVSFILSLLALMVAVSCCCYAYFTFRHTGTAEINSKEAGGDDIALEGVTVKDVTTEDTEDSEKRTQQGADKSASPTEEPSVTVSASEPTTVKSSEATEASASQETQEKPASASQEAQEKPSTEAVTDGDVVTENHVVDKTTQPEIKESPRETAQEANNVKETATEQQKTQDPEFPEPPEFPEML